MAYYVNVEKSREGASYTYRMGDSFEWGGMLFETPEDAALAALECMSFYDLEVFKEETGEPGIDVKVYRQDIVLTVTSL